MVTDVHLQQSKISTNMCVLAFQMGLVGINAIWPAMIVVITLLFALTTIMTWYFCASKMSIFVKIPKKIVRILFGITILTGAIWNAKSIVANSGYNIPNCRRINIFVILMLSKNRLPRQFQHLIHFFHKNYNFRPLSPIFSFLFCLILFFLMPCT